MGSGKTIDEIILQHSTRGMDIIQEHHPKEHCAEAARAFYKLKKGVVFLYTGFYVAGHAETDGPVGTYFLARALSSLGWEPVIITDEFCRGFFKDISTVYFPLAGFDDESEFEKLLDTHQPVAHFSIERCGVNARGKYANMRGKDISDWTAPVDKLFEIGRKRVPSFGIGDGGNEIGMGNFRKTITEKLSLDPCVINCDYPVIASVSNWGAYGFIALLEIHSKQSLLPSFPEVDEYLGFIVSLGSVDGVKAENVKSVDGKEWSVEREILSDLKASVISHFNSFSMTSDYDLHSKSQLNIGSRMVRKLAEHVSIEGATCLDLACGPGSLTNDIRALCESKKLKVIGVDIDINIINQAREDYPQCEFIVGSFYETGQPSSNFDYIFSNEGLHWTPRIPEEFNNQRGILYPFFEEGARQQYRSWGLSNLSISFKYIASRLTSKAILQFGLDGQLSEVYRLINSVLKEHFPARANRIKFPLFYPTADEVRELCRVSNLEPLEFSILEEDLFEGSRDEIVQFIRAFTENYLRTIFEPAEVADFYLRLSDEMPDIEKIRRKQWQRMVLVVEKINQP